MSINRNQSKRSTEEIGSGSDNSVIILPMLITRIKFHLFTPIKDWISAKEKAITIQNLSANTIFSAV